MREKRGMDSPAITTYGDRDPVGVSDQCREFVGRGLHSNGGAAEELAVETYEGVKSDDTTLGIPSGLLTHQIPDWGI
jgi:hypothetical protein